jgi:hypothetical protein
MSAKHRTILIRQTDIPVKAGDLSDNNNFVEGEILRSGMDYAVCAGAAEIFAEKSSRAGGATTLDTNGGRFLRGKIPNPIQIRSSNDQAAKIINDLPVMTTGRLGLWGLVGIS